MGPQVTQLGFGAALQISAGVLRRTEQAVSLNYSGQYEQPGTAP